MVRGVVLGGTAASAVAPAGASKPFSSSRASGGVFSVKNTSAGDREPSCSICCASTSSSSLRTFTVTPVCFSNALTSASVVCSCWPLYSVMVWPASDDVLPGLPAALLLALLLALPLLHAAAVSTPAATAVTGTHRRPLIDTP